jgi:hypothetical protein
MKFCTFLAMAALLGGSAVHAQQGAKAAGSAASRAETQADAKRLKQLNLCNKKARGKTDEAYQDAMAECMKRSGG